MAIFTSNASGKGTRATLKNGEDLYIAAGITVSSSNNLAVGSASGTSNNHVAVVMGKLSGDAGGLVLGSGALSHDQTLIVGASGEVTGVAGIGATIQGNRVVVDNMGAITGSNYGLSLESASFRPVRGVEYKSIVHNSGTIASFGSAIISANDGGPLLTLKNNGEINGQLFSFRATGDGPTKIFNTGAMSGDVVFGFGNDTYDGRKGHVKGEVDGRGGNDRLYGGTENNRLDGGSGTDKIIGGGGQDTFIFDTELGKGNVDTITDFAGGRLSDHFELSSSQFHGLSTGTLDSTAFHVGTVAADKSDRIIYDQANGDLYFDQDGSKSQHQQSKFAHLTNHADLFSTDFQAV